MKVAITMAGLRYDMETGRSSPGRGASATGSSAARRSPSRLSSDHRAVDGADAARFLAPLQELLEAAT